MKDSQTPDTEKCITQVITPPPGQYIPLRKMQSDDYILENSFEGSGSLVLRLVHVQYILYYDHWYILVYIMPWVHVQCLRVHSCWWFVVFYLFILAYLLCFITKLMQYLSKVNTVNGLDVFWQFRNGTN